jgi:hypothetical protein
MPTAAAIPYQMTGGNATLPPGLAQTMIMNQTLPKAPSRDMFNI